MRGLTRRGAGSIGLCWALTVVVAGCTEAAADPPPEPPRGTTAASSSPTPTPTPTPVAPETVKPERPAAMDTVDVDGAAAAAEYFLELYPYVYATGDLAEWKAMSHPECIFCASVVTNVEAERAAGGRSDGGLITIRSSTGVDIRPDYFTITLDAQQGPSSEYSRDGSVVDSSSGSDAVVTMIVLAEPAGWAIRGVEVQPVPAS